MGTTLTARSGSRCPQCVPPLVYAPPLGQGSALLRQIRMTALRRTQTPITDSAWEVMKHRLIQTSQCASQGANYVLLQPPEAEPFVRGVCLNADRFQRQVQFSWPVVGVRLCRAEIFRKVPNAPVRVEPGSPGLNIERGTRSLLQALNSVAMKRCRHQRLYRTHSVGHR